MSFRYLQHEKPNKQRQQLAGLTLLAAVSMQSLSANALPSVDVEHMSPSVAPGTSKAETVPGTIASDQKTEIWRINGEDCQVVFDEPFVNDPQSDALFAMCRNGLKEEVTGDLDKRGQELDDCFTINFVAEGKPPHIISGKEAALAAMKRESERFAEHPPRRIVFTYPHVQTFGDSAVVIYKCLIVGRGENPWRSVGYVNSLFVKQGDTWKQLHRRARWKRLSPTPASGGGTSHF